MRARVDAYVKVNTSTESAVIANGLRAVIAKLQTPLNVRFYFAATGEAPAALISPAFVFEIKQTPTGDVFAYVSSLTEATDDTGAYYEAAIASLDADALRTAIGNEPALECHGEILWTVAGVEHRAAFPVSIQNAWIRDGDGAPNPTEDASWGWIKATLPDANGFTHDDTGKTISPAPSIAQVSGLGAALAATASASALTAHENDTSNPHNVTKSQVGLGNVDNTSDANKPVSTATQNALNAKADASSLSAHESDTSNPHNVTKSQVGLGNVDNTSDANKPVSTATQNALNAKADASALSAHESDTSNPHNVTKSQVGLGNVDNTSDANKPVSTATQTALDGKMPADGPVPLTVIAQGGATLGQAMVWNGSHWAPATPAGGMPVPQIMTVAFTAVPGSAYQVDCSGGAVSVTMPVSPSAGAAFTIEDASLSWFTNNLTLLFGADNINGAAAHFVADVNGDKLSVCYINPTVGWSVK